LRVDLRGNAYRLTDVTQGAEEEQPSWSPGGARLAVVNGPVTGPYPPNFAIWALGTLKPVVAVGARNSEWPSWAPHGDAIAYQTPADSMVGAAALNERYGPRSRSGLSSGSQTDLSDRCSRRVDRS
jgi:Tol biopolymer transport system component